MNALVVLDRSTMSSIDQMQLTVVSIDCLAVVVTRIVLVGICRCLKIDALPQAYYSVQCPKVARLSC